MKRGSAISVFLTLSMLGCGGPADTPDVDASTIDAHVDEVDAAGDAEVDASMIDAPMIDAPIEVDACTPTTAPAALVPVDLYVMLSQSGSMADVIGVESKWDAETRGLVEFVSMSVESTSVGVQYYGLLPATGCTTAVCSNDGDCGPGCGPCMLFGPTGLCTGYTGASSCDPVDYETPDVEITPIPSVAPAISSSVSSHSPSTNSAILPALQGGLAHAAAFASAPTGAGHHFAVVLVTNIDPTDCGTSTDALVATARDARDATPPISTAVIAFMSNAWVDSVAAAGGTGSATIIEPASARASMMSALVGVRDSLGLSCAFTRPSGGITVQMTSGGGGVPFELPEVPTAGDCGPSDEGWYEDGSSGVPEIRLCPASCVHYRFEEATLETISC